MMTNFLQFKPREYNLLSQYVSGVANSSVSGCKKKGRPMRKWLWRGRSGIKIISWGFKIFMQYSCGLELLIAVELHWQVVFCCSPCAQPGVSALGGSLLYCPFLFLQCSCTFYKLPWFVVHLIFCDQTTSTLLKLSLFLELTPKWKKQTVRKLPQYDFLKKKPTLVSSWSATQRCGSQEVNVGFHPCLLCAEISRSPFEDAPYMPNNDTNTCSQWTCCSKVMR